MRRALPGVLLGLLVLAPAADAMDSVPLEALAAPPQPVDSRPVAELGHRRTTPLDALSSRDTAAPEPDARDEPEDAQAPEDAQEARAPELPAWEPPPCAQVDRPRLDVPPGLDSATWEQIFRAAQAREESARARLDQASGQQRELLDARVEGPFRERAEAELAKARAEYAAARCVLPELVRRQARPY